LPRRDGKNCANPPQSSGHGKQNIPPTVVPHAEPTEKENCYL